MIRGARESCTDPGLDADHISADIDDSKQLTRLFRCGQEVADTAEVIVFLEPRISELYARSSRPNARY
jgi:hypothetical protein